MPTKTHRATHPGPEDEGRALLARAPVVSLACLSEDGAASLRAVASRSALGDLLVRVDRADLGRRVVVGAHEHVVSIDDATYWVTAQAEGTLEPVRDETAGFVARVRIDRVTAVAALGQQDPLDERRDVVERLWRRGHPGDAGAVALLLARFPELGTPSFLRPRADLDDRGFRLQCDLSDHRKLVSCGSHDLSDHRKLVSCGSHDLSGDEVDDVVDLLHDLYWLEDLPRESIRAAVVSSTAVVAARDDGGRIVAFARAVSDRKCAWIYDVVVAAPLRGSHVGSAIMAVLLDHPAVRGARHVRLSTRDAMPFYRRLGFRDLAEAPRYPWTSTEMIRAGVASSSRSERAAEPEPGRAAADQRIDTRLGQLAGRS